MVTIFPERVGDSLILFHQIKTSPPTRFPNQRGGGWPLIPISRIRSRLKGDSAGAHARFQKSRNRNALSQRGTKSVQLLSDVQLVEEDVGNALIRFDDFPFFIGLIL
jgi:hypothetical protein